MKTIDFVISYLRDEATDTERLLVLNTLRDYEYKAPSIDSDLILQNLYRMCKSMISTGAGNNLQCIKYIKDVTGWGLKDCKDWFDRNIKQ
jgi:hypothetical protein